MKVIVQSEPADSGLAALAMVAGAHGLPLGLPELRHRFPSSLRGGGLGRLIAIGHELGFSVRPLHLALADAGNVQLPCILRWDVDHFVVLERVQGNRLTLLDPAVGKRRLSLGEASAHFAGEALELAPGADFRSRRPAAPWVGLRRLTGPVSGVRPALLQLLVLSSVLQVFVLLAPLLLQWVVDQVLVAADRDLLTVLGVGFGLVLALQVGIGMLRGMAVVHLSSRLGLQWAGNVFAQLLKLPLDFFEKRSLGDITSRLCSLRAIQQTGGSSFIEAVIDGVTAVLTLGLMLAYSPGLALLSVAVVFLYSGVRVLAWRPWRDGSERRLLAEARQQTHLLESLRGIRSLKLAGEEPQRCSSYDNLRVDTANQETRLARLGLGFAGTRQLLFGVERIAVVWIGATLALDGRLSVGMLIAYLAYKDQFTLRAGELIDRGVEFSLLRLHGERLADIMLAEPEPQRPGPQAPQDLRIEVENLCFRYADGEPWVVEGCSFSIASGESVALVGASGCGKTTLLKLLLGVLTPTAGSIRIGGQELHALGPRNVRRLIGAVMQDDQLFAGSIADNISFFDPEADPARIEAAARLAAVHEEIVAMTMGYHGLIGDMGSALSGGHRQRIILARALYRQPRLLYLDEATSHLDMLAEQRVNDAVRGLCLTRLIIAHRPETVASADRVLRMVAGRVLQEPAPSLRACARAGGGCPATGPVAG